MKIVKLTCENFMRLVAVEITPDGNTVLITGKNGSGKTSILDAIVAVLCGKKYQPDKPIRDGEERAEVVIETENWIIKRTFTAAGGGSVTITNVDGMRAQSPQALLNKIVGEIAFDPMEFINKGKTEAGKREQREILMKLAGLNFDDIDGKIAEVKGQRSDVRRDKERYEHEAKAITVQENLPDEEVSIVDLAIELQGMNAHNVKQDAIYEAGQALDKQIDFCNSIISQQTERVSELTGLLATATQKRDEAISLGKKYTTEGKALLKSAVERIDTEPITQKMGEAEAINAAVRRRTERIDLVAKMTAEISNYTELGKKMKELEAQKAERLSKAKMPLPGLSVTEDYVTYDGIPLSQVNDAKKLEIGMGIAMAENPELRVIRMNGNDLDDDSLKVISAMAADKDYQVWIERWAGGEGGIIIEDGGIKEA